MGQDHGKLSYRPKSDSQPCSFYSGKGILVPNNGEGKMRRIALFFSFIVSLLLVLCHGQPAEATQRFMAERSGQALSLLNSMAQDPDAVACVRRACLEVPYRERGVRHQRLDACKLDHFRRIASVMSGNKQEPQLRSYSLDQAVPPPDALLCERVTGQVEPSEEAELDLAFLREQEEKLAALKAEQARASQVAAVQPTAPVNVGNDVVPAAVQKRHDPSLDGFVSVEDELRKQAYAELTGPDKLNVAHCAPEHFTVRESDEGSVKLYVDAGAAYDELARSCFSKHYRTDAVSVVEENYVEATIPACIMPDGRIDLDPTRYAEILSHKRKLVMHGEPNLEFHRQCQAKGGKPWVALQGRQILWLAGKDKPRHVWPSQTERSAPVGQPSASAASVPDVPSATVSPDAGTDGQNNLGTAIVAPAEALPAAPKAAEPASSGSDAGPEAAPIPPAKEENDQPKELDESLPGGVPLPPIDQDGASRLFPASSQASGLKQPAYWAWAVHGMCRGQRLVRATSPPAGNLPAIGLRSGAGPPLHSDAFRQSRFLHSDVTFIPPAVTSFGS